MTTAELCERLTSAAWNNIRLGVLPEEIESAADNERHAGNSISADCMYCVAGIMRNILQEKRREGWPAEHGQFGVGA